MNTLPLIAAAACALSAFANAEQQARPRAAIPNPKIDVAAHRRAVIEATDLRENRRLTEARFIEMATDPDTVVLDARSESKYKLRHVKGAVNLPFTEFTEETLARVIPAKTTRVLIYCNNNFEMARAAFPGKRPAAALNLSTYTNLVIYGYKNVYELGPFLNVNTTPIPFEGTTVDSH